MTGTSFINSSLKDIVINNSTSKYLNFSNTKINNIIIKDKKYGLELKIISLPGHTNGSIGIIYKNYMFAGDALVNRRKKPQIAYQNQNTKAALDTYQKILRISPEIIFVGHDREVTIEKLKENNLHKELEKYM